MPADDKIVDEATTVTMIQQFATCQDECQRIQGLVDGAQSQLMARWGGNAANAYHTSMNQWQDGFNKVRQALNLLNESMVDYSQITTSTEDDNVVRGTGWATAVS